MVWGIQAGMEDLSLVLFLDKSAYGYDVLISLSVVLNCKINIRWCHKPELVP